MLFGRVVVLTKLRLRRNGRACGEIECGDANK